MESYVISALCFGLGYVVGRLDGVVRLLRNSAGESIGSSESSFTSSKASTSTIKRTSVKIDDKTFVTDVSTEGMRPSDKELGTITETHDNVGAAANRLAQLKKMKG